MKTIDFCVKDETFQIPNAWELLTPSQYEALVKDLNKVALGELSVAMLRVNFVCNVMEWDPKKIKGEESLANLAWLAEQVTFIFNIQYPENNEALKGLDPETRVKLQKTPPDRIQGLPIARYLVRLDYKYVLGACFCAQLIPSIKIVGKVYAGYKVDTSFDNLTCSLTALQYIEARKLIGCGADKLPLLVAILYTPGTYSSEVAHALAHDFARLPEDTLQAIAFNFQCFNNFLFTKTDFYVLTAGKEQKENPISTGALESLYNLSSDGMGDIRTVEQMNIIQYLTILRKKLIESVRSMNDMKLERTEIASKTGLPLNIINSIL